MKQTAVEWLAEKYDYAYWMVKRDEISPALAEEWKKHYLEQAKEMEKEQICDARLHGFKSSGEGWNGEYPFEGKDNFYISNEINNEQYYNETFKSE